MYNNAINLRKTLSLSIAITSVTTAAFCKARKKLSYTAFKALNACLIDTFYESSQVKKWHGHRLLAVDGSVTKLPPNVELLKYFGKARSNSTRPAVQISQLYDIQNKLSIDIQVDSHAIGERAQAVQHLACTDKDDLILYDLSLKQTKSKMKNMNTENINIK